MTTIGQAVLDSDVFRGRAETLGLNPYPDQFQDDNAKALWKAMTQYIQEIKLEKAGYPTEPSISGRTELEDIYEKLQAAGKPVTPKELQKDLRALDTMANRITPEVVERNRR